MIDYALLFLMGLLGGFLAGLIGIGGGIIYVLILPYVLLHMGVPEVEIVQFTIANSIVGTMFAGLSGNIAHIKRREFYPKPVLIIGLIGLVFSMLSLEYIVNTSWYQKDQFNPLIILISIFIILRTLWQIKRRGPALEEKKSGVLGMGLTGFLGGSISALSGLGGGIVIIPILNSGFNMDMRKAKSISLGVIFITSLAITIINLMQSPEVNVSHAHQGYVIFPVALALALGVSIASPLGVRAAGRFSNRMISYIFVVFLLVVIIDKIIQIL